MMALLLRARGRLFLLLSFLFSLIALFPLRTAIDMLALHENALSARAIHGAVWLGRIEQLNLAGLPLGDVEARLSPLPLFIGRARMDFVRHGSPDDLKGAVSVSNSSFGIDDVTASIGTGETFAPLPFTRIDLQDVSVRFAKGACIRAQGRVNIGLTLSTTQAFSSSLSGDAVCNGAALLLALHSQSGMERLNMRVEGNRNYTAELVVRPSDATQAAALVDDGFVPAPGGYLLKLSGQL